MKHKYLISLTIAFVCTCQFTNAQVSMAPLLPHYDIISQPGANLGQMLDTMYAHANMSDSTEGGEIDQIASFRRIWQERVGANDFSGTNMFQQYYLALQKAIQEKITSGPCSGGGFNGAWEQAGPDSVMAQVAGYVNTIWADANDSNYMLTGSTYGSGVFKTTDGGKHWNNITDNAPIGGIIGVNNITVNPMNNHEIYVGTGGAGIIKSFDGGSTWVQEVIPTTTGTTPTAADSTVSAKVFITEDSARLYAIYGKKLYTRSITSSLWADITPPIDSLIDILNMAFVPYHLSHFFICGQSGYSA